jgi:hypothetical protein
VISKVVRFKTASANLEASALPGQADLAWASSPCQDFSLAGARAGLGGGRSSAFFGFWNLMRSLVAPRPFQAGAPQPPAPPTWFPPAPPPRKPSMLRLGILPGKNAPVRPHPLSPQVPGIPTTGPVPPCTPEPPCFRSGATPCTWPTPPAMVRREWSTRRSPWRTGGESFV